MKVDSKTASLFKGIAKVVSPPPILKVSEWADKYRRLSSEASAEPGDAEYGCYAFDSPHCSECGKDFLVVPHYIVIDIKDNVSEDFDELESACMTAFEKRERERKFNGQL